MQAVERSKFEALAANDAPARPRTGGKTALERIAELDANREATLDPNDPTAGIPSIRYVDTTALMKAAGH